MDALCTFTQTDKSFKSQGIRVTGKAHVSFDEKEKRPASYCDPNFVHVHVQLYKLFKGKICWMWIPN